MSDKNLNLLNEDFKDSILKKKDNYFKNKKKYRKKILFSEEKIGKYNVEIEELFKSRTLLRLQYNSLIKNLNFEKKYEESEIKKLNLPYLVIQDKLEESHEEYINLINNINIQGTEKLNKINSNIKQCKNLIELEKDKIKKFKSIIFESSKEYNNYSKNIIKTNDKEFIKIKENYNNKVKDINNKISILKKESKDKRKLIISNFKKQNTNIKFIKSKLFFWNIFSISKLKNKNDKLLYSLYVELNNLKKEVNNSIKEKINLKKEESKNNKVIFSDSYKENVKEEIKDIFLEKFNKTQKNVFINTIIHVTFWIIPLLFITSILTLLGKVILPIEDNSYSLLSKIFTNPSKKTLDILVTINIIVYGLSIICYELVPILIIVLMSICLGKHYKINKLVCLILSISTYLILAPSILSKEFSYGVKDLFSAFLGTYITIKLYSVLNNLLKIKIINIKYLSDDFYEVFNSILLFLLIMLFFSLMHVGLFWIIKSFNLLDEIFLKSNVLTFNSMLSRLIQTPLLKIYNNYGGFILIVFLRQLFIFIGFNDKILFTTLYEVQDTNIFYNLNALLSPDNSYFVNNRVIFTSQFLIQILDIGGPGGIVAIVVLNILFSKEKDIRLLSIFSLIFVLFNINDLFFISIPLLFNLVLFIPFVISPLIVGTISYIATKIGLMPYTIDYVEHKTITILSGYFATHNGISILWWFIIFFLYFVCYLPFIFLQNKLYEWNNHKKILLKIIDANTLEINDVLFLREGEENYE